MSDNRIDTGGPAYPEHHYFDPERGQHGQHVTASDIGCGGMTMLDYFAGQALTGIIAHPSRPGWKDSKGRSTTDAPDDGPIIACIAYELAAAMLAEKRRREGGDAHA